MPEVIDYLIWSTTETFSFNWPLLASPSSGDVAQVYDVAFPSFGDGGLRPLFASSAASTGTTSNGGATSAAWTPPTVLAVISGVSHSGFNFHINTPTINPAYFESNSWARDALLAGGGTVRYSATYNYQGQIQGAHMDVVFVAAFFRDLEATPLSTARRLALHFPDTDGGAVPVTFNADPAPYLATLHYEGFATGPTITVQTPPVDGWKDVASVTDGTRTAFLGLYIPPSISQLTGTFSGMPSGAGNYQFAEVLTNNVPVAAAAGGRVMVVG